MIGVYLLSQSAPEKAVKKKAHKPLRTSRISQMYLPCFIIIQSYFDYRINKLFAYSRRMICVLCSDLDVLYAQRIIGFFLNYPQVNEVETVTDAPVAKVNSRVTKRARDWVRTATAKFYGLIGWSGTLCL